MKTKLTLQDHFYSKEEFTLLYDEDLDLLRTHPHPLQPETYYHSEHYISHSDQSNSFVDKLYSIVKTYSLQNKIKLINFLSPSKGRLLDIGAGTGEFLLSAKKNSWTISGVEPNALARNNASLKSIQLHSSLHALSANTYDVITLWHVLEHLPDLNQTLAQITALLKHKGILIIAAPNFKSYDANHYKEFWAAYDVPRHFWHFSKTSIERLFTPLGYTLEKIKPMWFDSFYVSLLSEKYKTGKNNYLRAFYCGLISNIQGLFTKEYSSHIYVLKKI